MSRARYFCMAAMLCFTIPCQSRAEEQRAEAGVTIAFVGDIMLDEVPGEMLRRGRDPFAPFAKILAASDIRVGNLECVIATHGKAEAGKPYTFRAHPRSLKILARHFDALALANNHSGDYGADAFAEMLDLLEHNRMAYFGGGHNLARAHEPLIIERKGLRIALLAYNEFLPRSFEADYDKPGIAWSENEQVQLDIGNARTLYHADLVIPFMHWGWEHEPQASQRQQQLAHFMIDAGADAVVGGHPHVTQNIEHYRGKPIIYSLGNFVFNGFTDADSNTGWLLQLKADHKGISAWKIFIAKIDRQGIPHPAPDNPAYCWNRGQDKENVCDKK